MSYDIYLVPHDTTKGPLKAVGEFLEDEDAEVIRGPRDPLKEERKNRVSEARQAGDTLLEPFKFEQAE